MADMKNRQASAAEMLEEDKTEKTAVYTADSPKNAGKTADKKASESIYTAMELADNYKLFHTSREIVVIALRLAGKESATFMEAKDIIETFKNKEVN